MKMINWIRLTHVLLLMSVYTILMTTFSLQYFLSELPCPLCFLQRVGMMAIAVALLMNLRFGFKPSHYAMILLACFYTGMVSLRQVALHVIPGRGSYGYPLFDMHLYTWCFIGTVSIAFITVLMMGADKQYLSKEPTPKTWNATTRLLMIIGIAFALANIAGFYMQCGWYECVDNPLSYEMLR